MALLQCNFYSQVLGLASTMLVILPEPASSEKRIPIQDQRYPTLYLLHGRSDDHTIWQRRTSIERYVKDLNLAVVMPAVERSFYTDMAAGLRYWTFISEELPVIARNFFPLSERREENYVAGLSMGGYGAFKLALSHPEHYAAAASLSGALDVAGLMQTQPEPEQQELKNIFGDLTNLVQSPNDLFYLAEQLVQSGKPRPHLYQCCGTEDILYEGNQRFRAHAQAIGLEMTYEEGPAGHEWWYWDQQIQRVLAWLPGISR
jgi:putative tributyrin esterase